MFVEYNPQRQTYVIHEDGIVRRDVSPSLAMKLLDAPRDSCMAIMSAARRAASQKARRAQRRSGDA
jgi:hypothetical protein